MRCQVYILSVNISGSPTSAQAGFGKKNRINWGDARDKEGLPNNVYGCFHEVFLHRKFSKNFLVGFDKI